MTTPQFLVVGGEKCGTTWLNKMLEAHPEICMPKKSKETLFFAEFYHKGLDWYTRYFKHCGSSQIAGEVCPLYMMPRCFNPILESLGPDVKILFMVRNPLEALKSKYYHEMRDGALSRPDDINDFIESLNPPYKYIHTFLYFESICRFKDKFSEPPRVWFHEDIAGQPERLLQSVYEYLGVDASFLPVDIIHQRFNPAAQARSRSFNRLMAKVNFFLKGQQYDTLRQWGKKMGIQRLMYKSRKAQFQLNSQSRKKLIELFRKDISGLSEYTKRDLSHWFEF